MDLIRDKLRLRWPSISRLVLCGACCLWALTGGSGCKKEDREPPAIAIETPASNFAATGTERVRISGSVSDNEQVSQVILQLQSIGSGSIVASATTTPSDNAFSALLEMGDRYSPTGEYLLKAVAVDPSGNSAQDSRRVSLTELPAELYGVWVATGGSGAPTNLYYLDSLGQATLKATYAMELKALHADNRDQSLLLAFADGRFGSYDPRDLLPRYEYHLPSTDGQINAYLSHEKRHYLGSSSGQSIRSYSTDGAGLGTTDDLPTGAVALAARGTYLYAAGASPTVSDPVRLSRVALPNLAVQSGNLSRGQISVVKAHREGEWVFAGGASGTGGYVLALDTLSLGVGDSLSTNSPVVSLAVGPSAIAFVEGGTAWIDQAANLGNPQPLPAVNATVICWESARNWFWVGTSSGLEAYGAGGTLQARYTSFSGPVQLVALHFNK